MRAKPALREVIIPHEMAKALSYVQVHEPATGQTCRWLRSLQKCRVPAGPGVLRHMRSASLLFCVVGEGGRLRRSTHLGDYLAASNGSKIAAQLPCLQYVPPHHNLALSRVNLLCRTQFRGYHYRRRSSIRQRSGAQGSSYPSQGSGLKSRLRVSWGPLGRFTACAKGIGPQVSAYAPGRGPKDSG